MLDDGFFPEPAELKGRTATLLEKTETLRHTGFEPEKLAQAVVERQEELRTKLAPQLTDLLAARTAVRNLAATIQAVLLTMLGIALTVVGLFHSDFKYLDQLTDGVVFWTVTLADVALLALIVAVVAGMIQRNLARAAAQEDFDRALDIEIRPLLRSIINDWEENEAYGNEFDAQDGPALVELATEATISSRSFTQVREFIASHDSSAIGIAGNRGIGKSTVMDRLEQDKELDCLTARVQAPVLYDAAGLIRLIHVRLAEAATKHTSDGPSQPPPVLEMVRVVAKAVGAFFFAVVLMVTVLLEQDNFSSDNKPWEVGVASVLAIAVSGALVAYGVSRLLPAARREALLRSTSRDIPTLGRQQLAMLEHTTEVQTTSAGRLAIGRSFVNRQQQVKLTENTLTHAENVARLRRFFERLGVEANRVLICVDELDKMSKPDDVIATINSIKDLMHVPGVHFVVSVSTDAMHQFAMRGVPLRDVFDSTFDAVVTVRRMTFDEARQVLRRRTIEFPVPAMMFCHAWSGGVARDLIRTARACVDLRKNSATAIPIERLVATILRDDLVEILNAAVAKLRTADATKESKALYRVYHRLKTGSDPLTDEIDRSHRRVIDVALGEADGEAGAMAHALPQLLQLAALTAHLFATGRRPAEWRDDELVTRVEKLAEIRSALNVHPDAAAALLDETKVGLLGSIRMRLAKSA
ncbi:P-loop NTPase fold protein [Actinoplanes sp. NPDC051633]|uniref:P-loop NTPase fold protein n=1 Tax=Actinoplanes sp. NPDC051633 TaxID=3155670 RepID=UPI003419367A